MDRAHDRAGGEERGDRRWRPNADVVYRNLGGEVVLVHLQTNKIFALNATGARLWELLIEGHSHREIRERLLEEFTVTERELDREVEELLSTLQDERLVVAGN